MEQGRLVPFLVEAEGALAGVFNLGEIVRGGFQSAYLGYYAYPGGAGRGVMTVGMGLVLGVAFGTLGLHRVEANIQPGNARSIALAKRAGFRLEGFSPRYLFIDGAWRDHERWAKLADD
jgi:ribosomal-protein-alanine N-acetyltransferase